MHGTFRSEVGFGTVHAEPFDARARNHHWRSRCAVLLAGCCLAALPTASPIDTPVVAPHSPSHRPDTQARNDEPPALRSEVTRGRQLPSASVTHPVGNAIIRIVLPEPLPVRPEAVRRPAARELADADRPLATPAKPPSTAPVAVATSAPPVAAVGTQPAESANAAAPAVVLRPVDVAQISDPDLRSTDIAELHEPGLVVGGDPTLATKIAAMQVTPLPPVRDADRTALLAEAPTQMTVRLGGTALGKVDFRMSDARTIDVKVGNLLDLLAGHYDTTEFARLRDSAAADAYVSFDQLRALGLKVRYDPAYDEVRINS